MIRPQWLRQAATVLPSASRSLRTSALKCNPSNDHKPDASWPLLRKRASGQPDDALRPSGGSSLIESLRNRGEQDEQVSAELTAASTKTDGRIMLILQGLSTNLAASDFYRLAPSDLSSWQNVIKKVQQQRNPTTLAPLGRYHVSFATAAAAISYRDKLLRLHALSRHKLQSPGGLWESRVPHHLRPPAGEADAAAELEGFTVVPGSLERVDVVRRRVTLANRWAKNLSEVVAPLGYGDKPPVVLLRAYPPSLEAADIAAFIEDSGRERMCSWKVSKPQELAAATQHGTRRGHEAAEMKSRFVIACADESEARRFHRQWNAKTVTKGTERHVLYTSIISW